MDSLYFKSHVINQTKIRSFCGKAVSAIAVGTYLGDAVDAVDRAYEQSLVRAGEIGINFFDTAINYRCQRSEKNIGYAVKKLSSLGIKREELFMATKGGFLPALDNPESFQFSILQNYLNTGIITPDDIVKNCHCMTPQYLQSQINLSLHNMNLDFIDLYYLHNPETQLAVIGETAFYKKLKLVFELFEKNVALGKIKNYGLATWNGFRAPFGSPERLDLAKIIGIAKEVAGDKHHFKAIQLPYNLAMLEAVALPNQKVDGEDFPAIAAAAIQEIGVFISAPLYQGNILRLPKVFFDAMPGDLGPVQKALNYVISSPGVIAAMVGMGQIKHVDENLAVLKTDKWDVAALQAVAKRLVR